MDLLAKRRESRQFEIFQSVAMKLSRNSHVMDGQ